jgi:hypothetical protein
MKVTRTVIPFVLYLILFISMAWAATQAKVPSPTLGHIKKLQKIAKASNGGALGCGIGRYVYTSSTGEVTEVQSGLDAIHVFGQDIHFKTLDMFVQARVAGERNADHADFSDLYYVILSVYARTGDPGSLDAILKLNLDNNDVVARWAGIATAQILQKNPELEATIQDFYAANNIPLPEAETP